MSEQVVASDSLAPVEAALRKIFTRSIEEHEAFCLAMILQHSVCKFADDFAVGPLPADAIVDLLRRVSQSVTQEAAATGSAKTEAAVVEDAQVEYAQVGDAGVEDVDGGLSEEWLEQCRLALADDPVLSNHDRMTILRLSNALLETGGITALIAVEGTSALLETADGQLFTKEIK